MFRYACAICQHGLRSTLLFQEGRTALHLAAEQGHLDTVEVLADFNAGPNTETIVRPR